MTSKNQNDKASHKPIETYAQQYKAFPIAELKPFENNSRTHSAEQIEQIKKSINEFGFTNPIIVDLDKNILAGHGRVQAAKELGLNKLPCIIVNGLTEAQKRAYIITDNQISLNSGWDMDLLRSEVDALKSLNFDIDLLALDDSFYSFEEPIFEPALEDYESEKPQKSSKLTECPQCGCTLS